MTTISRTATLLPQRQGVSYLIAMMIAVVATGGIAYAIFGDLEGTFGTMTGADRIEIIDLNAYTRGDTLVITGNIKNIGNSGMDSIVIDEISVGGLVLTQTAQINDGVVAAGHGTLSMSGIGGDTAGTAIALSAVDVDTAVAAAGATITVGKVNHGAAITANSNGAKFVFGGAAGGANAVIDISGLSTDEGNLAPLPSGASQSFRITVTGVSISSSDAAVLDILATVPASSDLFASFTGTDGTTTTISDPRSTTVTRR